MKRFSKYNAKKKVVDGIRFDSGREAERYMQLSMMQERGEISGLELQKKFVLIPKQIGKDGKVKERECSYKADFCYTDEDGNYIVEDTKGMRTADYKIKRKLMLYIHGIEIKEV